MSLLGTLIGPISSIIDKVIPEPTGGAHRDHAAMIATLKKAAAATPAITPASRAERWECSYCRMP